MHGPFSIHIFILFQLKKRAGQFFSNLLAIILEAPKENGIKSVQCVLKDYGERVRLCKQKY